MDTQDGEQEPGRYETFAISEPETVGKSVVSTLTIYTLRREDQGMYECHLKAGGSGLKDDYLLDLNLRMYLTLMFIFTGVIRTKPVFHGFLCNICTVCNSQACEEQSGLAACQQSLGQYCTRKPSDIVV